MRTILILLIIMHSVSSSANWTGDRYRNHDDYPGDKQGQMEVGDKKLTLFARRQRDGACIEFNFCYFSKDSNQGPKVASCGSEHSTGAYLGSRFPINGTRLGPVKKMEIPTEALEFSLNDHQMIISFELASGKSLFVEINFNSVNKNQLYYSDSFATPDELVSKGFRYKITDL